MNVLSKDGSMKIQVGANDGETITIDLKKIDSDTLIWLVLTLTVKVL